MPQPKRRTSQTPAVKPRDPYRSRKTARHRNVKNGKGGGQFVSKEYADANPDTTVRERRK